MFWGWEHILFLTTGYTGANKKHRMSTVVDISALRVELSIEVLARNKASQF